MNNGIPLGIVPGQIPAFKSTPIASPQDQSAISGAASHSIYTIINKIDRLDSGIKAIKNNIRVLNQMECKINELKKSNRKAMNRSWSNQKANPTLKTKAGNK